MNGKMQESGLTEIIPLKCTSALWGQYPAYLHPKSPPGALNLGVTAVPEGLAVGILCLHPESLRAHPLGHCVVLV